MKKGKKILIMVVVTLVMIGGYFGYKAFNLLVKYKFHNQSDITHKLEIKGSINLDYYQNLEENEEYLEFKNVKIRNDFKDFEYLEDVSTEDSLKYVLYDENKNRKAAVMIGVGPTYVELLKSDITIFGNDDGDLAEDDLNDVEVFLKENGINNDIHLFKYIVEHKDDKSNIFTSTKEMKDNYILYYIMNFALPSNLGITIIDGTYAGYIFDLSNGAKEVSILYYDKRYVFTFFEEDYFSDEYVYELLNTIVIESSTDESGKVIFKSDEATFTRTYSIVEVVTNNSMEYDSFEIKQFQNEETVIVDIKKDLASNIDKGKIYEFTFKKDTDINIEDGIKGIFENYELISVVETDKVGLEQSQESIK